MKSRRQNTLLENEKKPEQELPKNNRIAIHTSKTRQCGCIGPALHVTAMKSMKIFSRSVVRIFEWLGWLRLRFSLIHRRVGRCCKQTCKYQLTTDTNIKRITLIGGFNSLRSTIFQQIESYHRRGTISNKATFKHRRNKHQHYRFTWSKHNSYERPSRCYSKMTQVNALVNVSQMPQTSRNKRLPNRRTNGASSLYGAK